MVKATSEKVAADMSPPNYRAAVQRIRTIPGKKEKIASVNGEISDIWGKVEGHKVNKVAGRIFLMLDGKPEDRLEIFRDLNGLIDAAGWPAEGADLVDEAQGNVVPMRAGKTKKGDAKADDTEEQLQEIQSELDGGDSAAAADQANTFIEQARRHLGAGRSGQASANPDADLAGGPDEDEEFDPSKGGEDDDDEGDDLGGEENGDGPTSSE